MPIARLIAQPDELLSRLENLRDNLEKQSISIDASSKALGEITMAEVRAQDGTNFATFQATVKDEFAGCDGIVTPQKPLTPHVFISDMDSTMIGQECIDELADFAGLKDKVSDITERAMQGELDFESALRERVSLLAGLDESAIQQCLDQRIAPNPGAKVLVETLKSMGCKTVLVTGGFHHFADAVAQQIGFERVVGNRLAVAEGKLTGELDGPVVDSSTKKDVLEGELAALPDGAITLAAGDGANDIPMLEAATYGAAYYAKPKARAAANCWIDGGDLTSILDLLGISRDKWIIS